MTTRFECDQKELLVAYLYDEVAPGEQQAIEAHLDRCAACHREVEELRGIRGHLSAWTPPEPELGFRIVRGEPARVLRPWWRMPVWGLGLAAAAVIVLVALATVANLEVRYDTQGVTVRTGWASRSEPVGAVVSPADLQALEKRLRDELAAGSASATPSAVASGPQAVSVDQAAILRRVSALIGQSEERQQRELALRLTQIARDVEQQRRADWVRISQGFGRLEDLTGAGVMQQREMMNYLMRVSQRDQR